MSNTITDSLYLADHQKQQVSTGQSALGKDDFLKILITQLQNQDPQNPMEDKEFISQMATFSSLEQMTNINKTLDKIVNINNDNQLLQHSELIGKVVKWSKEDQVSNDQTTTNYFEGIVTSVRMENGTVRLEMEDGTLIRTDQLIKISGEPKPEPDSEAQ